MKAHGAKDMLPTNALGQLFLEKYRKAVAEIHKDVIELDHVIEQIFIAMLGDGHVILEGEPGVGKTLVINIIARTIDAKCSRIQFSPETMPSDLLYSVGGFDDGNEGKGKTLRDMRLAPGPLFTQILIGDEINRSNPRVHAGLLEVLEEKQITVENKTTSMGDFYFAAFTQNPIESAQSTSELPEALQERLLLMVHVPYPSAELLRRIAVHDTRRKDIVKTLTVRDIVAIQHAILEQYILRCESDDPVIGYIERLINAIHDHEAVLWGPGIRAAQDLTRASAVHAFLHGRASITFDDIRAMAKPALRFKFIRDVRKSRKLEITSNDEVISLVLDATKLAEGG